MKIRLIRLRLIGDVVFTTPLIRALKRTYPDAHLTYLVEPQALGGGREKPHLDEVIVARRRAGLGRIADDLRLAGRLRRERYDIVIDLHGGPRSAWLAWLSRATVGIGYEIAGRTWMYTRAVPRPRTLRRRHSVVNQWDLLEAIEGWPKGGPSPTDDAVEMGLDAEADSQVGRRLEAAGVTAAHEVVVVHVSAGNPFRRWPEPAFATLVSGLASGSPNRRIVLSSGPSDREAAARIGVAARQSLGSAADRGLGLGGVDPPEPR